MLKLKLKVKVKVIMYGQDNLSGQGRRSSAPYTPPHLPPTLTKGNVKCAANAAKFQFNMHKFKIQSQIFFF